ncbi:hypothetical protein D039_4462B, partial [Vibrio parahaemolyticus EKP-028]
HLHSLALKALNRLFLYHQRHVLRLGAGQSIVQGSMGHLL